GPRGEQLAELVTDDQEAGQRREWYAGRPGPFVVPLRREVSAPAQQFLPSGQFTGDGAEHAVDEGQLVAEVGDDSAGVWKAVERGEGRATLEVHQHQVEDLRVVGDREGEHQRAQQLALT